jgi:predicted dehydrogenase
MRHPRLGFAGLGWIGGLRLEAVAESGRAEVSALCDPAADRLDAAGRNYPAAALFTDYSAFLARAAELRLDGVVLATPNALHAEQAMAAFDLGLAVFCQKPLARSSAEVREVLHAARLADRLLGVDYSYRHTRGARELRRLVAAGEFGPIRYVESVFHNAYGPDKPWCYEPEQGGGALLDLGVHQIDLALWLLGAPAVEEVAGLAFAMGQPLSGDGVEDFATAQLALAGGTVVHMAVSWNAHVGKDCEIRTALFGSRGGAEIRNIDGSFYDFETVRHAGRTCTPLERESREWMSGAILEWSGRLAEDASYDAAAETSLIVAEVVDAVYHRSGRVTIPASPARVPQEPGPERALPAVSG